MTSNNPKIEGKDVQPVLLGADLNCYSVARAFHEAYGIKSKVFARYPSNETKHSRIVDFTAVPDLDTRDGLFSTLNQYSEENPSTLKILLGCKDEYASLLIQNKDELSQNYIVPTIDNELREKLINKESFYRCCDEYDIPYPQTVVVHPGDSLKVIDTLAFKWPIIIKPSSSIDYWKHAFDGMEKVYEADSPEKAKRIIKLIFGSGYSESIIIQDRIPGDDSEIRVLTAYCDRNAKVKMACLGHVLLEIHTPLGRGNHAAILTEDNPELINKLALLLESVGYVGFANFDIKYDSRDGEYKVFEINLRQGRSNYYVTGAGLNLARYLVDDWVLEKDLGEPDFCKDETFWRKVPAEIVWEHTGNEEFIERAKLLSNAGRETVALDYEFDLHLNLPRKRWLKEHNRGYFAKYQTYVIKDEQ